LGFFLALLLVIVVPVGLLNFIAGRRRRKFASQLPDMLQLLAGSLRAGYSLLQGVDAVALEVSDPMGQELRRVLAEARLGRPLEDALDDAAERMSSPDFSWAVMAVGIQREVGGNLAELLDTVAETMIQRERLRREVKSLTAEGRVSAIILGLLPVGLGVMMFAINRAYIEKLFNTGIGQVMLGGSTVLALAGFIWMKKIVEIEI
jgi:tight adherence protein B